jgi:hypothetical protein
VLYFAYRDKEVVGVSLYLRFRAPLQQGLWAFKGKSLNMVCDRDDGKKVCQQT